MLYPDFPFIDPWLEQIRVMEDKERSVKQCHTESVQTQHQYCVLSDVITSGLPICELGVNAPKTH